MAEPMLGAMRRSSSLSCSRSGRRKPSSITPLSMPLSSTGTMSTERGAVSPSAEVTLR